MGTKKVLKIASGMLTIIVLVSGLLYCQELYLQRHKIIKSLLKDSGIADYNYENYSVSYDRVVIHNVELNGRANIKIPKLELKIKYNILRWPPLRIHTAKIDHPVITRNISTLGTHIKGPTKKKKISDILAKTLLRLKKKNIRIIIKGLHASLFQNTKRDVKARVDLDFSPQKEHLEFTINQLSYGNQIIAQRVRGSIILDNHGTYFPFLVSNTNKHSHNWQAKGKLKKDLSQIKIFLKNSGIPDELKNSLRGFIHNTDDVNYAMIFNAKLGPQIQFTYHAATTNLKIKHPAIAPNLVGPIPLKVKIKGSFTLASGELKVNSGQFKLINTRDKKQAADLIISGKANDVLAHDSSIHMRLKANINCENALRSVPNGFAKNLSTVHAKGNAGIDWFVDFSLDRLDQLEISRQNGWNSCSFYSDSKLFSEDFLRKRQLIPNFKDRILTPQQYAFFSQGYTDSFSEWLAYSIIANEDSGFWVHKGYNLPAILEATKINLREGYYKIGASTITMQVVKNLYFSKEKTISRKFQELVISQILENKLSKKEILSIYANIIEYGPSIYGIRQASQDLFGVSESQLSPEQAIYLGSILPTPKLYFKAYCNGDIAPSIKSKLSNTLERIYGAGWITREQYLSVSIDKLKFEKNEKLFAENCPDRINLGQQQDTLEAQL